MSKIITVLMVFSALLLFPSMALADKPADDNKKIEPEEPPEPVAVQLSREQICEMRYEKEGLPEEKWRCHDYDIIGYLVEAGVPETMRTDFLTTAACESAFVHTALGDGGWSKGLLQIRWDFWAEWADVNGYAYEMGYTDTPEEALTYFSTTSEHEKWDNPVINFQLGLTINYYYDMPRHGRYWVQWTGHPHMEGCATKRDQLLANIYGG